MNYTDFCKLKMPEQEEYYNVDDFNDNCKIIDTELSKKFPITYLKPTPPEVSRTYDLSDEMFMRPGIYVLSGIAEGSTGFPTRRSWDAAILEVIDFNNGETVKQILHKSTTNQTWMRITGMAGKDETVEVVEEDKESVADQLQIPGFEGYTDILCNISDSQIRSNSNNPNYMNLVDGNFTDSWNPGGGGKSLGIDLGEVRSDITSIVCWAVEMSYTIHFDVTDSATSGNLWDGNFQTLASPNVLGHSGPIDITPGGALKRIEVPIPNDNRKNIRRIRLRFDGIPDSGVDIRALKAFVEGSSGSDPEDGGTGTGTGTGTNLSGTWQEVAFVTHYSTEEQNTGKLWIDNRAIMQRTWNISVGSISAINNNTISLGNIKNIIPISCKATITYNNDNLTTRIAENGSALITKGDSELVNLKYKFVNSIDEEATGIRISVTVEYVSAEGRYYGYRSGSTWASFTNVVGDFDF